MAWYGMDGARRRRDTMMFEGVSLSVSLSLPPYRGRVAPLFGFNNLFLCGVDLRQLCCVVGQQLVSARLPTNPLVYSQPNRTLTL